MIYDCKFCFIFYSQNVTVHYLKRSLNVAELQNEKKKYYSTKKIENRK